MKRLLALFLAVIMICALLPAAAFAATNTLSIMDSTSAEAPTEVDMSASASGTGWQWDASKKVLTLNGFKGRTIEASTNLKIVLKGTNTMTLTEKSEFGIRVDGKLTIDKSSDSATDKLTINQKVTASSSNLIVTGGDSSDKACVINGGTVTLNNSSTGSSGNGIYYATSVNNDANLSITVPNRGVASRLNANTTGTVNITTKGSNAFAAAVYSLYANGSGTVTLNANAPAVTVLDSLNIAKTAGSVVLNGYTKVAADPVQTFSVAPNKKVQGVDNYWQGCYTTDPAGNPGYYLTDSQGNPLSNATYVTVEGQPLAIMDSPRFDLSGLKKGEEVSTPGLISATRGGSGGYSYALKSGSALPAGLLLDSKTGAVYGTPTKACEGGSFTVVATDSAGATAQVVIAYSSVKAAEDYLTVDGTVVPVKEDASSIGWTYVAADKTLKLSGYNGGVIKCDTDLNIILNGPNTVTVPGTSESGIKVGGKLTIDKTNTSIYDSLTVKQAVTTTSANLIVTGGSGEANACVINGGNVTLQTSQNSKNSIGVENWVYVNNDAMLTVTASYRGINSRLYANTAGTVTVSTKGNSADAAAVGQLYATGSGSVSLTAPETASTVYEALTVADTAGTVILNGPTKVLASPYQNIKLAANKRLQSPDAYYLGYNTTAAAGKGYYIVNANGEPLASAIIMTQSNQALAVMDSAILDLPAGVTGVKLNADTYLLNATRGGSGNYSYALKAGSSLPAGLTLNAATGAVSGTPTTACTAGSFTVVVSDGTGATAEVTVNYGQIQAGKVTAPVISTSNVASTGKIKLSWTVVPGAEKYVIYRATSKTGTYSKLSTCKGTSTSFTNTSVTIGKTYYYKVKTLGYDGSESGYSNIVSRCCDCAQPVVTAANLASTGKIKLSWAKIEGASKYEIYRATSVDGTYSKLTTVTGTSYTNTSVTAGKTYYYKVKAIATSTSSANSAYSVIAKATCKCAQPVVTVTNVASSGKIKLSWSKIEGAAKYEIYRATSSGGTYTKITTVTGTSFTNTTPTAGKTYYYKVKAISADTTDANSAYSKVVSRTCDCAKPVVKIALSSGHPKISWTKVDGANKYYVYRATSKSGTYTKIGTSSGVSYTNTSAKAGTTYYYKVVAVSNLSTDANSAYSAVVSIKAK